MKKRIFAVIMAVIMIVTFAGCSSTALGAAKGMYTDKSDFGVASNSEEAKIIRQSVTDYLGHNLIYVAEVYNAEAKPDSTQMAIYYDKSNDEFTVVFYGPFIAECANGARQGNEFYRAEFGDGKFLPFEVLSNRKQNLVNVSVKLSGINGCIYDGLRGAYGKEAPAFKLAIAPVSNFDGNKYSVMEYVGSSFNDRGRWDTFEITEVGDEILGYVDLYQ